MVHTPRREAELERDFFKILAKYARNTMLFLGSFSVPAMLMTWIAGAGVVSASTLVLAFLLMFAGMFIGLMYWGAKDLGHEQLKARHQVASIFGAMFLFFGAIPAFQTLPVWRALLALAVAPISAWVIWRTYARRSGIDARWRGEEVVRPREDGEEEEGVVLDFEQRERALAEEVAEVVRSE